jgi:oxygen-independent coproporphyrinogen-3 oxidase
VNHLYVHIPFCSRRCSYCDFSIAVRQRVPGGAYVEAVRGELRLTGDHPTALRTLYFGGGTPSHLPVGALEELVRTLVPKASSELEFTLEANPEDVSREAALVWRRIGVTRISLGAQSFDDRALRWMHRVHGAAETRAAVGTLRDAGFSNVSLDLIFGLPSELDRDWRRDLEGALTLEPTHLSLYGLTVEARTPLARWVSRGATRAPDDERYADEYLLAHDVLGRAGFEFYEVSNAARGAHRSQHNSAYWSGQAYVGLGPAAHSFDGGVRRWNIAAWEAYRRAVGRGTRPVAGEEHLTPTLQELERRYLALRTIGGLEASAVPADQRARWRAAGWITPASDRVRCTAEGWLRLDALITDLTGPPEPT